MLCQHLEKSQCTRRAKRSRNIQHHLAEPEFQMGTITWDVAAVKFKVGEDTRAVRKDIAPVLKTDITGIPALP